MTKLYRKSAPLASTLRPTERFASRRGPLPKVRITGPISLRDLEMQAIYDALDRHEGISTHGASRGQRQWRRGTTLDQAVPRSPYPCGRCRDGKNRPHKLRRRSATRPRWRTPVPGLGKGPATILLPLCGTRKCTIT